MLYSSRGGIYFSKRVEFDCKNLNFPRFLKCLMNNVFEFPAVFEILFDAHAVSC